MSEKSLVKQIVLNYIQWHQETKGYSPSRQDITENCGMSTRSIAQYYLQAMREEGMVDYVDGVPRTLVALIEPEVEISPEWWSVYGEELAGYIGGSYDTGIYYKDGRPLRRSEALQLAMELWGK